MDVSADKIKIFADVIQEKLGVRCSALSGANVANEGKKVTSRTGLARSI